MSRRHAYYHSYKNLPTVPALDTDDGTVHEDDGALHKGKSAVHKGEGSVQKDDGTVQYIVLIFLCTKTWHKISFLRKKDKYSKYTTKNTAFYAIQFF